MRKHKRKKLREWLKEEHPEILKEFGEYWSADRCKRCGIIRSFQERCQITDYCYDCKRIINPD